MKCLEITCADILIAYILITTIHIATTTLSGKTLAFLIPLLEKLYRRQYTPPDGPGAIVLSPTRELAVQTFQVLRNIGSYHHFSAGLLVGGKKEFGLEQQHVPRMNIVVATPGRLLQHLEQTAGLDVDRVCMLVLDEADVSVPPSLDV